MEKLAVLMVATVLGLASVASAEFGTATYYTPPYTRLTSACYGYTDSGVYIAAASEAIWDDGAACGSYYGVTCMGATNDGDPHPCTGASITVKIVDLCPPGCKGTIDLSREMFELIANTDAGKIKIQYVRL